MRAEKGRWCIFVYSLGHWSNCRRRWVAACPNCLSLLNTNWPKCWQEHRCSFQLQIAISHSCLSGFFSSHFWVPMSVAKSSGSAHNLARENRRRYIFCLGFLFLLQCLHSYTRLSSLMMSVRLLQWLGGLCRGRINVFGSILRKSHPYHPSFEQVRSLKIGHLSWYPWHNVRSWVGLS